MFERVRSLVFEIELWRLLRDTLGSYAHGGKTNLNSKTDPRLKEMLSKLVPDLESDVLKAARQINATSRRPMQDLVGAVEALSRTLSLPPPEVLAKAQVQDSSLHSPIQALLAVNREISDALRDPLQQLLEANRKLSALVEPIQKTLTSLHFIDSQLGTSVQELLKASGAFSSALHEPIAGLLGAVQVAARKLQPTVVEDLLGVLSSRVVEAGAVAAAGSSDSLPALDGTADLASLARELTTRVTQYPEQVREVLVDFLAQLRRDQRDSLSQQIVLALVMLLIAAVVNPIADHYIKERLSSYSFNEAGGVDSLTQLQNRLEVRIVSVDSSPVRVKPGKHARIVARLREGHMVLFVKKEKRNCLVLFQDATSSRASLGWIRSKHLRKPN